MITLPAGVQVRRSQLLSLWKVSQIPLSLAEWDCVVHSSYHVTERTLTKNLGGLGFSLTNSCVTLGVSLHFSFLPNKGDNIKNIETYFLGQWWGLNEIKYAEYIRNSQSCTNVTWIMTKTSNNLQMLKVMQYYRILIFFQRKRARQKNAYFFWVLRATCSSHEALWPW